MNTQVPPVNIPHTRLCIRVIHGKLKAETLLWRNNTMNGLYYQVIDVTDNGPYVTKLILSMPREVSAEEVNADTFSVYAVIREPSGDIVKLPKSFLERDKLVPSQGYRTVECVYPCDEKGCAVKEPSRFVAVDMKYGPIWKCSSAIASSHKNMNGHGYYMICDYTVTQTKTIGEGDASLNGLVFDHCAGVSNPKRDLFTDTVSDYAPLPLKYGYYVPDLNGGKKALIVWLHGAGEGGQDTAITYTGNAVPNLASEEVQKKFGGAFIFSPQCPTMWLDNGTGQYNDSGESMYTEALKAAIDGFIARFADVIDMDRIYVGGDSNGGFMTMRMIMSYPDFFAAAFPICEAMLDARITDEHIAKMKDLPVWFTHAKKDPVVPPAKYVVPTYERLIKAGAKNVHFTFWDEIIDTHYGFTQPDGSPWKYFDHFAWVPMLNDDCRVDYDGKPVTVNGKEVSLLDWLALQKK